MGIGISRATYSGGFCRCLACTFPSENGAENFFRKSLAIGLAKDIPIGILYSSQHNAADDNPER
jgi:hypothetical protein